MKKGGFDECLRRLDEQYNLRLRSRDASLSPQKGADQPSKSTDEEERVGQIRKKLHYLSFHHEQVLEDLLLGFDDSARAIYPPRTSEGAVGHVSLALSHSPRARSRSETFQLQKVLLDILEEARPRIFPQNTSNGTGAGSAEAPASPKRSSGESRPSLLVKRLKPQCENGSSNVLDGPVKTQLTSSLSMARQRLSSVLPSRPAPTSRSSASTSKASMSMASRVFTEASDEEDDFPDSQTTVEASSQEKQRAEQYVDSPPSPYSTSPDFEASLYESFTLLQSEKLAPLDDRLRNIWPPLPASLNDAPLTVCWETTRIALYCGVCLGDLDNMVLDKSCWSDQSRLRQILQQNPLFAGKKFPAACSKDAWEAGLSTFQAQRGAMVKLGLQLTWNQAASGPLFHVSLQPLKLELGHRLGRRFGPDRFLEVILPSLSGRDRPKFVNEMDEADAYELLVTWVSTQKHFFLGRLWAAFYTNNFRKTVKRRNEQEPEKNVTLFRVHFFAEDGHTFVSGNAIPSKTESMLLDERVKVKISQMLNWAVSAQKNAEQPALKLYCRLALSLSQTVPTVVLEPHQIRHHAKDILSPAGIEMNDGIARMSSALAKQVSDHLGLQDVPSAFQGRFGSAKGLWIRACHVEDTGDEIWIETYPSQRKWVCDFVDESHRTFEVSNHARELKPASLNMQFIPVLTNRALNEEKMRRSIARCLEKSLDEELERQRSSMNEPTEFRQWIHETFSTTYRNDRVRNEGVKFLAGLPENDAERMNFLLDGGFHPLQLRYLRELSWALAERKGKELKKKMNIRIGRSTYAYMAVDFLGVLEEGEVHFGFSSKFQSDEFSDTLIHGMDVLVARSPAHYPSDIQRVKAVFRPELSTLKDIIIFSSKGDSPLAGDLSGGDYDGDMAWVCFDPDIVNNFKSASVPPLPDLFKSGFLRKEATKFSEILTRNESNLDRAVAEFFCQSFKFNMKEPMLGQCTDYKEKLCYKTGRIDDDKAIKISTLLSHLVDQAKQGIVFERKDWDRLQQQELIPIQALLIPAYKTQNPRRCGPTDHVLDWLMFGVIIPKVNASLKAFNDSLASGAENWDKDLAGPYDEFEGLISSSGLPIFKKVLEILKEQLLVVQNGWSVGISDQTELYPARVQALYEQWQRIELSSEALASKPVADFFRKGDGSSQESCKWALLKASTTFKLFFQRKTKFAWIMAGRQLQMIKGRKVGAMAVVPRLYGMLRPDRGLIAGVMARRDAAEEYDVEVEDVMQVE